MFTGAVLAEDLASKVDDPPLIIPPWTDLPVVTIAEAVYPCTLTVVGLQAATGENEAIEVGPREAVRIMTGAPMLRYRRHSSHRAMHGQRTPPSFSTPKAAFCSKTWRESSEGIVALTKGRLTASVKSRPVCTMGHDTVPVFQRLRIAIVSTGDELKSPGEPLSHGEIYESNSFGLAGLVEWSGHTPRSFPSVADTMDELRDTLTEAADRATLF